MKVLAAWSLFALILMAGLVGQVHAQKNGMILVVVTAPPLENVVREVGGEVVEVKSILPPGAEPHSYEPGIQEIITSIQNASLIVMTGPHHLPVEERIKELSEEGLINVPILNYENYQETGLIVLSILGSGAPNPHGYVYSINGLKAIAKACASELSRILPEKSDYFAKRLKTYLQRLSLLEEKIDKMNVKGTRVILSGPILQYIAEDLGLKVEKVVVKAHGAEPSSEDVMEAIRLVRKGEASLILLSDLELAEGSNILRTFQENRIPYVVVPLLELSDQPELASLITASLLKSGAQPLVQPPASSSPLEILLFPSLLANLILIFFLILLLMKVRRYG